jgi:chaperone required for assembly of F1-ATPase
VKRFWDHAEAVLDGEHYVVQLDGRRMRLPGGPVLRLANRTLAEAIAAEWQSAGGEKGGTMSADDVPLTRLAGTAQERIAPDPGPSIDALATYSASDLLCYHAETPVALAERQATLWGPWLEWAARTHGAQLRVTRGLMPVAQPQEATQALRAALARHCPFTLAGLGLLVPATGSLVLGLAVADGALSAEAAHELSLLDELFQAEAWGEDREAALRRRNVARDIADAGRFMKHVLF